MQKVVQGKTIAIRPTIEETENLNSYMEKHKLKKPSEALKQIIKDELPKLEISLEKEKPSPQLEKVPHSFSKEGATGILLSCPKLSKPIKLFNNFVHWKPPVDTSVCKTCSKYPCESWQDYESWKKANPDL